MFMSLVPILYLASYVQICMVHCAFGWTWDEPEVHFVNWYCVLNCVRMKCVFSVLKRCGFSMFKLLSVLNQLNLLLGGDQAIVWFHGKSFVVNWYGSRVAAFTRSWSDCWM